MPGVADGTNKQNSKMFNLYHANKRSDLKMGKEGD